MSEFKEKDDRKFGQYVLNSSIDLSGSNINADELANACRRLGISGPLEPLLRDLKIKNDKYVSPASPAHNNSNKDSPQRKSTSQRGKEGGKQRLSSSQCKGHSPDYQSYEHSDSAKGGGGGGGGGGYGKNSSYGKESWGRDSGARDLSPEPNSMHRMHETLATENQSSMDTETGGVGIGGVGGGGGGGGGGTSAMLHLASKVSLTYIRLPNDIFVTCFHTQLR